MVSFLKVFKAEVYPLAVAEILEPVDEVEHGEREREDDARHPVYPGHRVERGLGVVHGARDALLAAALLHVLEVLERVVAGHQLVVGVLRRGGGGRGLG